MKKLKRLMMISLTIIFLSSNLLMMPVQAEIPEAFWALQTEFQKAVDESNNNNIIYYGEQILSLFRPVNFNDRQSVEISAVRSELVGTAYEALGDYENAIKYYKDYVPLATNRYHPV